MSQQERVTREIEICKDCGAIIDDSSLQERPRSRFYESRCQRCGIHAKIEELDGDAGELV